ncbi:MAG: ribonuclease T2 [bacterium]
MWRRLLIVLALLLLSTSALPAAARPAEPTPGAFDYYVLSLSWSPQYCAASGGSRDAQCGGYRPFAFVLHGLWPQFEKGFPKDCGVGRRPSKRLVESMLDIMPSPALVQHEWSTHGSCSGMSTDEYFATARRAFDSIEIPPPYQGRPQEVYVAPSKLKRQFLDANPRLRANGVALLCSGRYLQEVRICLDRQLAPHACGRDVRDRCKGAEIIVRPVR